MQRDAQLVYRVPRSRRGWELSEETMPESVAHDEAVELLKAILAFWARGRADVLVARNLAVRWDEDEPRIGVDPDVSVLSPRPPRADEDLRSLRTWLVGHEPPALAVEIVSETNPHKDYVAAPDKYAASGTRELWVFDPLMSGPRSHGGPFRLQVWRRDASESFVRAYAGDGPVFSEVVGGWLIATDEGRRLRIASDPAGDRLWRTGEEAEREAKADALAAKADALARVAQLEAELRALRGT